MGSGDACVALAGGEGARGTATRATQASPPHASSTPAPTGQRGFFLLNLTPMGYNSLRPVGWIASPGGRNELRPYAPLASFPVLSFSLSEMYCPQGAPQRCPSCLYDRTEMYPLAFRVIY